VDQKYNSSVKAVLLNRITLVLGSIGLYVAMLLTLEKAMNITLPCGSGGGCAKVAEHPSGYFLTIPVAYFGLVGYLLLSLIAVLRFNTDRANFRSLTVVATGLGAIGTLASLYLQLISFTVIHAVCPYCLTSAVAMTLIFVTQVLLLKETKKATDEQLVDTASPFKLLKLGLPLVALAVAGIQSTTLQSSLRGVAAFSESKLGGLPLIGNQPHSFGDEKAPITIVEFADLGCPTCQKMAPQVKEFIEKYPGKVRLVYRHFLIDQHEMSPTAAAMAEIAADKGRFWDYTRALMAGMDGNEIHDVEPILSAARAAGLDPKDMLPRLQDTNDPVYQRISDDRKVADAIGVKGTPTFILMVPGKDPQIMQTEGFRQLMGSDLIDKLIKELDAKK